MSLRQVHSCGICEIFKNSYFEEHLRTTASETCSNFTRSPFLITYTSGSNWYICFSFSGFCIIIYSFVSQFSLHYYWYCHNHKQSPGGVLQKRCSYKFSKIHKKTPALKTRFADLQSLVLLKKRFRHRCFLVNSC